MITFNIILFEYSVLFDLLFNFLIYNLSFLFLRLSHFVIIFILLITFFDLEEQLLYVVFLAKD